MPASLFPVASQQPGEIERSLGSKYAHLLGVDEAGRGALCGPVIAAAVALPDGLELPGLDDSKKVPEPRRRALAETIRNQALCWGIGLATAAEVDEHNVLQATFLAMRRAIDQATARGFLPDLVLVDGPHAIPGLPLPQKPLVKGDCRSRNVAAASILAKTERDAHMHRLHQQFPAYGFDRHVGYATAAHRTAIAENGLCPEHRKSFCCTTP